ncbi:hypothetical protein BFP72_13215 [Reichenbachiella sp. 5M10]|uniref:S41 family peptidase n=1 Tax=Reichenbachiella sp. 5M10 TaxID=1889772 RepID=UPI000C14DE2A|nr:S41 family peptidase [Reichenbachiella sp. 5M10]PIB36283.1 hypothetical protein BFP72_13215 [Reichenbachiella sp. 5M10]
MKNLLRIKVFVVAVILFMSCEKVFMHPNTDGTNKAVFEEYAKISIEKFGLEEVKGIDLRPLVDSIRPLINESLSEQELFNLMSIITLRMQEGHTNLTGSDDMYTSYLYFAGYPVGGNFSVIQKYYGEENNPTVRKIAPPESLWEIVYGFLPDHPTIGFIQILTFDMEVSNSELDEMMEYLSSAEGIIIDVRSNLGGYIELGARMASRFTDEVVPFGTIYVKNGPEADDFAPTKTTLTPSDGPHHFTKPVAVLHDRITFSTGSLFSIMMYHMDHVTTLGIPFGGGTGEIMDGMLQNGWIYTISTANFVDEMGRPTDNGIEPDIPVVIDPEDTVHDAIIERAIMELKQG